MKRQKHTPYYQIGDIDKIHETERLYEKIKKDHFVYKLIHFWHDPIAVILAVILAVIFAYFIEFLKSTEEKRPKHFIVIFVGFVIILWIIISAISTIL